jgi:serine/threonine-protein kinase
VYALTGVLYECLTGEVPYPKPSEAATLHAHVMQPPPVLTERRPDLPPALDGVIAQGMAKDPWSRPSQAAELIQAASRALSSSASSIPAPSGAPQHDGSTAERERRVQTTKVPAVGPKSPFPQPAAAGSADPGAQARSGVTRQVSRPRFEPAAPSGQTSVVTDEPAAGAQTTPEAVGEPALHPVPSGSVGLPNRLVALVAALTLAAFLLGFVVGLIVH